MWPRATSAPASSTSTRALPAHWLDGVQLATMLGVFEYLVDPGAVMSALAGRGVALLCSYCCADLDPNAPRPDLGWINAYDMAGFEAEASAAGFTPAWRYLYEGKQALWLWLPPGADAAALTPVGTPPRATTQQRPSLVVGGFLGRGNCGDEAIFQVIHETFAPRFDIVASVDEHGAHRGFWDWYPYTKSKIVHQNNLACVSAQPRVAGMLVGGGGLPCGFVADQVHAARLAGVPTAFAGVDLALPRAVANPAALGDYLRLFDYVGVRNEGSVRQLAALGLNAEHGADWALRLVNDRSPEFRLAPKRVALVARELPLERIGWGYLDALKRLVDGLRALGAEPFWLPFCPEDERFLRELALDRLAPMERCWWNARRMKQVVGSSGALVSIGRLHPLIFAASTRTPVLSLTPPLGLNEAASIPGKLLLQCAELGIAQAASVDEVLAVFARGAPPTSDGDLLKLAEARLGRMIERLRAVFGG